MCTQATHARSVWPSAVKVTWSPRGLWLIIHLELRVAAWISTVLRQQQQIYCSQLVADVYVGYSICFELDMPLFAVYIITSKKHLLDNIWQWAVSIYLQVFSVTKACSWCDEDVSSYCYCIVNNNMFTVLLSTTWLNYSSVKVCWNRFNRCLLHPKLACKNFSIDAQISIFITTFFYCQRCRTVVSGPNSLIVNITQWVYSCS